MATAPRATYDVCLEGTLPNGLLRAILQWVVDGEGGQLCLHRLHRGRTPYKQHSTARKPTRTPELRSSVALIGRGSGKVTVWMAGRGICTNVRAER
jgi:hypothetical protein